MKNREQKGIFSRTWWLMAVLCGSLWSGLAAQHLPEPMSPPRLVNDFAAILTSEQRETLEQKLVSFDRETSTQIVVVTVDSLQGYAPSDFAQRLHDKWGVGRAGKNNGIVVLVKPKQADSRGEAFISVGYGLEGVVPDITAGRILDREMIPQFREGRMYEGIDQSVEVLMQLTRGEFTADSYDRRGEGGEGWIVLLVLAIFILFAFLNRKGGSGHGHNNGGRGGGMWVPPIILGGGSRGGGFGGGGFGGGFGGFGGGASGGGGGGRSW